MFSKIAWRGFLEELSKIATSEVVPIYLLPSPKRQSAGKEYVAGVARGGLMGSALAGLTTTLRNPVSLRPDLRFVRGLAALGATVGAAETHQRRQNPAHQGFPKAAALGTIQKPQHPFAFTPARAAFAARQTGTPGLPFAMPEKKGLLPLIGKRFRLPSLVPKIAMAKKSPAELKTLKGHERDLVARFQATKDPQHLDALMTSVEPILQKHLQRFRGVEIPEAAVDAEARKLFAQAARDYNPNRGASFSTHLNWKLQGLSGFVKTNQNIGKIPREQIGLITKYNKAKNQLSEELDRAPTPKEIAQQLNIGENRVHQLERETKGSIVPSGLQVDPIEIHIPKEIQAIDLLQHDHRLSDLERKVHLHLHGLAGFEQLRPGAIAKKLGVKPTKISQVKTKLRSYLNEIVENL